MKDNLNLVYFSRLLFVKPTLLDYEYYRNFRKVSIEGITFEKEGYACPDIFNILSKLIQRNDGAGD